MPLVHDPEEPQGGPGSAFLTTTLISKGRRRRKKKAPPPQQQQTNLIGQDLLDWQEDDDENVETPTPIKPSLKTTKKKKRAATYKENSNNATAEPMPKRAKKKSSSSANKAPNETLAAHVTPMPLLTGGLASMTPPAPRVRHALAVDTRALDTTEGMAIYNQHIRLQALEFLGLLTQRGAAPCIFASSSFTTTAAGKKSPRGGRAAIQATAMSMTPDLRVALERGNHDGILQPVSIRPPVNAKNVQNRKAVLVPKRMLAHDSWKLFGDLVEAVVKEDRATEQPVNNIVPPLDVTVLTNDVSFLCDTKPDCHKRGLNRFWERTRPLFENNYIRSVEIVVAETGSVVLSNADAVAAKAKSKKVESNKAKGKTDSNGDGETITAADEAAENVNVENKEVNVDASQKKDETEKDVDGKDEEGEESLKDDDNDSATKHKVASVKCIQSIHSGLSTRAEADYRKTRSSEDPPSSVVVNLSTISNDRLGYHTMVQKRLNELLALNRDKGTVSFDLPENLDGMQCALSLEATCKVFPFRADSIAASLAMADLRLLSQSKFEVLKLIPLSCVDACLFYGNPMEVCAKYESDLGQYNEMKALVGVLFRYLSEKEVALMLRLTDDGDSNAGENSLHHKNGQTFLLMAKDLPCRMLETSQSQPPTDGSDLPSCGLLKCYATADQLLDSNARMPFSIEGYTDSLKELADFLESSMDSVENSSSNPLVDYALLEDSKPPSNDTPATVASQSSENASISEDAPWTDNDGVGARVAQAKKADTAMDDIGSDSDDSIADMYNQAFNYD